MKLVTKERLGARVRRRYDGPRTPLERVRQASAADPARVAALVELQRTLDPFALAQRIDQALAVIYRLANHRVRAPAPRVDAARPVDATNAPTRSSEKPENRFSTAPTRLVFNRSFGNRQLWLDRGSRHFENH